jgi:hypothetical protein
MAKKGGSGTRKEGKSAVTGRFVTDAEVKRNPRETFTQTMRTGKPKGRGK